MLRFENYFCCLFNCYFIFCSYVLMSKIINLFLNWTEEQKNRSFNGGQN